MTDRRRFIALGASAGAAAVISPLAAAAQSPSASPTAPPPTCTPSVCTTPTTATPVPWTRPSNTVTAPRRAIADLTPAELVRLRKAYAAMRALPASDPRSLQAQRNLHAWYCATCPGGPSAPGGDIHFSWTFLPWHRMFLYFHERILGGLVGDFSLRLPYWDWETRPGLPLAYGLPANNPLYDPYRYLKAGQSVERMLTNFNTGAQRYYQLSLVHRLLDCSFADFGGTAPNGGGGPPAGGVVEAGSHGFVHVSSGGDATRYDRLPCSGDMAILNTAANDPIFYTHHANLDRLWDSWEKTPGNADPTDPAFQSMAYAFFDENGKWVSMAMNQITDIEHALGVTYERLIAPAPSLRAGMRMAARRRIDLLRPNGGTLRALGANNLASAAASVARARNGELTLGGVPVPGTGEFRLAVRSANGVHVLTDIFAVPHAGSGGMRMNLAFNVCTPLWGDYVSPPNANPALIAALLDPNKTFHLQVSPPRGALRVAAANALGVAIRPRRAELVVG